jgi:hypothetical protein
MNQDINMLVLEKGEKAADSLLKKKKKKNLKTQIELTMKGMNFLKKNRKESFKITIFTLTAD